LNDSSRLIFNSIIRRVREFYSNEITLPTNSLSLLQGRANSLQNDILLLSNSYEKVQLTRQYQEIRDSIDRYCKLVTTVSFSSAEGHIEFGNNYMLGREFFQKLLTKEGINELKGKAETHINYKLRNLRASIEQAKAAQSTGYSAGFETRHGLLQVAKDGTFKYPGSTNADGTYHKTLFEILGVSNGNKSKDDVRRSFKKLSRKYHPDLNPGDKSAEERFKLISQAWEAYETWYEKFSQA
jgi:hypothetical protein